MNRSETLAAGVAVGLLALVVLVVLAIHIVICYLLSSCFRRIPAQHRKMEPGLAWLLLIPCFQLVWNFFVCPRLSESYLSYFLAQGRTDVGDCGRNLGMAYAICSACALVPYVGILPGLAALVLLIIYLVKALELRGQIPPAPAIMPSAAA
jgi:hypothetical protein